MDGLPRRIIAIEAGRADSSDWQGSPVARACDRMRVPLTNLMGVSGFASLTSRALAMARQDDPSLCVVTMRTDGSLEGFEEYERGWTGTTDREGKFLVARLVGLLATFVGESLTLRLMQEVWPELIGRNNL